MIYIRIEGYFSVVWSGVNGYFNLLWRLVIGIFVGERVFFSEISFGIVLVRD